MPLSAGTRLGPYQVVSPLGAGGMGEVYRAHDSALGRDVAIKVLPDAFAGDAERLARFEREARALASLNHPNIAHIYGVESSGTSRALVMELVEGEDLRTRLNRGRIPLDEALTIARQIADALDAAHHHGIIHRDLKPGNIQLRRDGTVKVLDFGLAKAGAEIHDTQNTATAEAVTMKGEILGTAAYMSPEQATGGEVDRRADIWAFGCVFYEMVSGRRVFDAPSTVEILSSVMKSEPDWSAIASAPPAIQSVIRRCLQKDPAKRVHDIADVKWWIEDAHAAPAAAASSRRMPLALTAAVALLAIVVGASASAWYFTRPRPQPKQPRLLFQVTPNPKYPATGGPIGSNFTLDHAGTHLAYHSKIDDTYQIVLRSLETNADTVIEGTQHALSFVFSPDDTKLAFISGTSIRTIPVTGGASTFVCDTGGEYASIAWADTGDLLLAQYGIGLSRVPATGGVPEVLVPQSSEKDQLTFFSVSAIPGGAGAFVTLVPPPGQRGHARLSIWARGARELKTLLDDARYGVYTDGHIVYSRQEGGYAMAFDRDTLTVSGPEIEVMKGAIAQASIAEKTGLMAFYEPGANLVDPTHLALLDPAGKLIRTLPDNIRLPRFPRVSPDGKRMAVTGGPLNYGSLWVINLANPDTPINLIGQSGNNLPVWEPAGNALIFSNSLTSGRGVQSVAADGSVSAGTMVLSDKYVTAVAGSTADGKSILFEKNDAKTGADLMLLDRATKQITAWLQTPVDEGEASISPDARWVAYVSNQTGKAEVWLRSFAGGAPLRVSADGGHEPRWSHDNKAVYFQSRGRMYRAAFNAAAPSVESPRMLFEGNFATYDDVARRTYDVLPDGSFIVMQMPAPPLQSMQILMNWR